MSFLPTCLYCKSIVSCCQCPPLNNFHSNLNIGNCFSCGKTLTDCRCQANIQPLLLDKDILQLLINLPKEKIKGIIELLEKHLSENE